MFGSRIVRKVIADVLNADTDITAVVGDRIHYGANHPQKTQLPALLFYMEQADYGEGAVTTARAEHLRAENFRFVVRIDDTGGSDSRIAPAAEAQLAALQGLTVDTTHKGENVMVTFAAIGEVPVSPYDDGGTRYQTLGTVYSVELRR
jgi:hypothetical protein